MSTTERPRAGGAHLSAEPYDGDTARWLVAQVQQEYVVRYGGHDETRVHPGEFAPPRGLFLVARVDGVPVACGGWRSHGRDAEIKRMYVLPAARRRGIARAILDELEHTAALAGHVRMILETGQRQPEAIALYRGAGYEPVERFGHYHAHEGAVHLGKALPPPASRTPTAPPG